MPIFIPLKYLDTSLEPLSHSDDGILIFSQMGEEKRMDGWQKRQKCTRERSEVEEWNRYKS